MFKTHTRRCAAMFIKAQWEAHFFCPEKEIKAEVLSIFFFSLFFFPSQLCVLYGTEVESR